MASTWPVSRGAPVTLLVRHSCESLPAGATDRQQGLLFERRSPAIPKEGRAKRPVEQRRSAARDHFVRLAFLPDGSAIGFVEASQRGDYVNGTSTSPVAFLEGLYVEPSARRRALHARLLLRSSGGQRRTVVTNSRPIHQLITCWRMQHITRLASRKRNGLSIFVGPCMVELEP